MTQHYPWDWWPEEDKKLYLKGFSDSIKKFSDEIERKLIEELKLSESKHAIKMV